VVRRGVEGKGGGAGGCGLWGPLPVVDAASVFRGGAVGGSGGNDDRCRQCRRAVTRTIVAIAATSREDNLWYHDGDREGEGEQRHEGRHEDSLAERTASPVGLARARARGVGGRRGGDEAGAQGADKGRVGLLRRRAA